MMFTQSTEHVAESDRNIELEQQYVEMFGDFSHGIYVIPLPDNVSLAQPSPLLQLPTFASNSADGNPLWIETEVAEGIH